MSNNYGEIFCQAAEILAQHLINEVAYDKTLLCTIINDDNKNIGKYRVQNGEAIFDAFASDSSFKKGDQVYVQIPMGNWNEQKLIVAKKMNDDTQPVTYKDPFDSYVNITNNIIEYYINEEGLIANHPRDEYKQKEIWACNKEEIQKKGIIFNGYTRLAISADFKSWLKDLGAISGEYGLNLVIELEPEDIDDIQSDNNSQVENLDFKICSLNCNDMIGNPYNFESYYSQKKLFDISSIKNIKNLRLFFYQKEGSFLNSNNQPIEIQESSNIFVKDVVISLGYDVNSFNDDSVIIYTMDTVKYDVKKVPLEENHKLLNSRWIHRFNDGSIKTVDFKDDINYTLTWYRYEQGARSHTSWSGVDWIPLATQTVIDKSISYSILDQDWIDYNNLSSSSTDTPLRNMDYNKAWLLPDIRKAEERIKAIIVYDGEVKDGIVINGKVIESGVLIFSNVTGVVSSETVEAMQALVINCEDSSFGNYLIYNQGGKITDYAESQKVREFKLYFDSTIDKKDGQKDSELLEADEIEWIIPTVNTMIDIGDITTEDNFLSADNRNYVDNQGFQHIFRVGEIRKDEDGKEIVGYVKHQNTQRYRIKSYYTTGYTNNTIKCIITRNRIKYTAIKELTFGPIGTSGTDYTFVLDFNDNITALTLASDYAEGEVIPKVIVQARLYDYTGKEIPNLNMYDVQWSLSQDELDDDDINNNITTNDYVTLVRQDNADQIEIQLLDSVTEVPEKNFTVLKAVLKSKENSEIGWGDFDLYAYLPIPIRSSRNYQFISGTTTIHYNSLGYLDDYFQNPYCLYYLDQKLENAELTSLNGSWQVFSGNDKVNTDGTITPDPYKPEPHTNSLGQMYIRPINIYVENSNQELCVVGSVDNIKVWSQPLVVFQNKYPSSIINHWNGELVIDEKNNVIMAAKIAAGKKHDDDNTFSGVMMGDWSGDEVIYDEIQDPNDPTKTIKQPRKNATGATETAISNHTGIYGFQRGVASFGFRDDGTAFIGKPGSGRLEFDGHSSVIESNAFASGLGGLSLDFDDGIIEMYEPNKQHNSERRIILDASADLIPFEIGTNFSVDWDGAIWATSGHFEGLVEASEIRGTDIYTSTLHGDDGTLLLDGYLNVNDEMWIGYFTGADGSGNTTDLYGIKVYAGSGAAFEANGGNVRIGNNSGSDSIILKGDSLRWHTDGIVGTGENFTHSRFILKANQIEFTCDETNQHGIYARFA